MLTHNGENVGKEATKAFVSKRAMTRPIINFPRKEEDTRIFLCPRFSLFHVGKKSIPSTKDAWLWSISTHRIRALHICNWCAWDGKEGGEGEKEKTIDHIWKGKGGKSHTHMWRREKNKRLERLVLPPSFCSLPRWMMREGDFFNTMRCLVDAEIFSPSLWR